MMKDVEGSAIERVVCRGGGTFAATAAAASAKLLQNVMERSSKEIRPYVYGEAAGDNTN